MANKPTTKVYNNSLQIHGLPNKITLQPGKDVNGVRVPGLNFVDSEAWANAKENHEQVRVLLEEKILTEEVIPEPAAPESTDPAAGAAATGTAPTGSTPPVA